MPHDSAHRQRRAFLKRLPATLAAAVAAPSTIGAQGPVGPAPQTAAASADGITSEVLAAAQHVAGVSLPPAEREAARPLVANNLANIERIRRVEVPPAVEPAFSYRPPLPPPARTTRSAARPVRAPGPRPANIEDLAFESAASLGARLRARQVTSSELTEMYLDRLKRLDSKLMCVVTFTEDLAREEAAQADRDIRAGRYRGPLHGIPYGIKDLFSAKGIPTTWGAKPYANQVFDYDATVVTRLREAGAVLVAKLATGELAVGDLWFRGRTRNPWNLERGSSGSSAGPASATAAGLVGFAVGTETNGSIVSPASTCGVVGLRPTYGRISRHGCMTLRWTLDKVGALARTVEDTALVLEAVHGPDGHDETVAAVPFSWSGRREVRGLRIGYLESEFSGASKPFYDAALEIFRKAGAAATAIALPDLPSGAMYALFNAEAGAMFDELVRSGAINELADKGTNGRANQLRAARFIPAVDYIRAQRVRTLLLAQMNALFDKVDVIVSPASSAAVTACNLTGHPAVVVPAGFINDLPIGLLVSGPLFREDRVLTVAAAFEAAAEWRDKHPTLS
jgi:Asp-tRNA(Asn)/Glu-tRNA(Gln) amidotransferase A subunit family amidase